MSDLWKLLLRIAVAAVGATMLSGSKSEAQELIYSNRARLNFNVLDGIPSIPRNRYVWNGQEVKHSDFRGSFAAIRTNGKIDCSATLIAELVILTAAHCIEGRGSISIRVAAEQIVADCMLPFRYRQETSLDYALCKLSRPIPNARPERLARSPLTLRIHQPVLLTGFGCTTQFLSGGDDGTLRVGFALIDEFPASEFGSNVVRTTKSTNAKAAVCPHDSGSGVFLLQSNSDLTGRRVIVGVVSGYGRISRDGRVVLDGNSYFASTLAPEFYRFLVDFVRAKGVVVCAEVDSALTKSC